MSVFSDLDAQASAEIVVAIDLQSADPVTQALAFYRLTDAPRLYTLPTDSPPNAAYRGMLTTGVRTELALTDGPTFTGAAPPNRSWFSVSNAAGVLGAWRDRDWAGQPVTVRRGGIHQADGQPYMFADFETFILGKVSGQPAAESDSVVKFELVGRTIDCAQQVVNDFYRGLGGAVRLIPDARMTKLAVTAPLPMTVESIGRVDALPLDAGDLIRFGSVFGVRVEPDGTVALRSGPGTVITPTPYKVVAGEDLYVAATLAADLAVEVYAGKVDDIALVFSGSIAEAPFAGDTVRAGRSGAFNPSQTWDATTHELRIWSTIRTPDEILANANGPIFDAKNNPDIFELWKFGDGSGLTARGEKGLHDLTLANGAEFVSSLEGDDPEQFGGTLLDVSKPRGWGPQFNVPVTAVGSQFNAGQWSSGRPSDDLTRLRSNGGEMLPEELYITALAGDLSFVSDADGDHVNVDPGAGFNFRRFVPRQVGPPPILGQKVDIWTLSPVSGSPDFIYRVQDVAPDFLSMTVVEPLLGDPIPFGFPVGPGPVGSAVGGSADAASFAIDLSTSSIALNLSQGGVLTADVVDPPGVDASVSTVYAALVDPAVVVNELVFNPGIGTRVGTGESMQTCKLLDEVVRSGLGWRAETLEGDHRIGNYSAPTGPAVASIIGSRALDVVGLVAPFGRIVGDIDEMKALTPYSLTRFGYDQNWLPQETVVGSVTGAFRERLRNRFREVKRRHPENVRRFGDDAAPMGEPLPTLIIGRPDAETLADRATPLVARAHRWYNIPVQGLPSLAVRRADVVLLEHPDPDYGLAPGVGVLAVVVGIASDTASDETRIMAYT